MRVSMIKFNLSIIFPAIYEAVSYQIFHVFWMIVRMCVLHLIIILNLTR